MQKAINWRLFYGNRVGQREDGERVEEGAEHNSVENAGIRGGRLYQPRAEL